MKSLYCLTLLLLLFFSSRAQDNALHFDGANDYVEIPNTSAFELDYGTMECWIKPSYLQPYRDATTQNPNTQESCIMGMRGGAATGDADTRFSVHISSTTLGVWNGTYIDRFQYIFRTGEWYHLAFVWNIGASSSYIKYYVNGNYLGQTSYGFNNSQAGYSLVLGMAKSVSSLKQYYQGAIDELRIWVIEKSEAQIQARKNEAITLSSTSDLIADYKFDRGTPSGSNSSYTTVPDLTGNRGTGTLYNFSLSGNTSNFVTSPFAQLTNSNTVPWTLNGNAGTDGGLNAIGTTDNQRLAFKVNGAEKLTLLPNGNFGIGTSSPKHTFSVVGGDGFTVARVSEKNYCFFEPNSGNGDADWSFGVWNGGWSGSLKMDAKAILFGSRSSPGQVIIGINENDALLNNLSAYKLAVNGSAIFNKVVVKATTNWPDYVFKSKYKLPTLKEIERYIRTNNHLPGVPGAQEVEKNDLDIAANQAVLLRKIEELTLYLIEQDKKIGRQQKQISQLKAAKNK